MTRAIVLARFIDMKALVMLNSIDDDDDELDLETKRTALHEMLDAKEEWLFGLLDGVSDEALDALAHKNITTQAHLVEISKLFDKVGVDDHKGELLKAMVPGHGYDPEVDDNVRLPRGVRPEDDDESDLDDLEEKLDEFVDLGIIDWIDWFVRRHRGLWDRLCYCAAYAGRLEVLEWARANGCPWDEETCSMAAGCGHFEVLKWARENGCPWDRWTCHKAAYTGHLRVLAWARAHGCPWNEHTCAQAAYAGHLEVLKWARANGCPWNEETCSQAAYAGHLEVLKWARAHGCPWDKLYFETLPHADIRAWVQTEPDYI